MTGRCIYAENCLWGAPEEDQGTADYFYHTLCKTVNDGIASLRTRRPPNEGTGEPPKRVFCSNLTEDSLIRAADKVESQLDLLATILEACEHQRNKHGRFPRVEKLDMATILIEHANGNRYVVRIIPA